MVNRSVMGMLFALIACSAGAEIFVYVGPNGERVVSDRPFLAQSDGYELLTRRDTIDGTGHILAKRRLSPGSRAEILSHVRVASRRYNIDPDLVEAVIQIESGFDANAVSSKGAAGLMQLMDGTAQQYAVTERHDPRQNVHAGTRHLAGLLRQYAGDVRLALAAYNAGAGAVEKYRGVPPYPETRRYILKVLDHLATIKRRSAAAD